MARMSSSVRASHRITHSPYRKVVIEGVGAPRLEGCFIEAGRQHIDQVDIAGEFGMLLLGDAARDEDAEMADGFMHRVDDRLPVGPDLIDVGIEIEDPVAAPAAAG